MIRDDTPSMPRSAIREARPTRSTLPLWKGASGIQILEAALEASPAGVAIIARDGRFLWMNGAGLRDMGVDSRADIDGIYATDLVAVEQRDAWRRNHALVCQGRSATWTCDRIGIDGIRHKVEVRAIPIRLADGSTGQLSFAHTLLDAAEPHVREAYAALQARVREQTNALQAALGLLEDSELSFGMLVRSVTDYALFMLDAGGRVMTWNAGAERIKGYSAEEIIGEHFACFYTPEDQRLHMPEAALATAARDRRVETEAWRVRKDGSRFWASVVIDAIVQNGQVVGFAKITRDITEKKAAEARLRQAQKMEAIGQFTGGVAHDFNNLLMAISGSLELLRNRLPADAGLLALVDNAMQGAERGASLTRRMLTFARRQELKREAVGVDAMLAGIRDHLERLSGEHIVLDVRVPQSLPAVHTDPDHLASAVINLAQNARDAMPLGGALTIAARASRVGADNTLQLAPGAYVCLAVTDTGEGMDESTLARAGEPFFTTKGIGKGTGLGLAMVDGLAAQSGGRLVARSRPAEGTTMELWLPVAIVQPSVAGRSAVTPREPPAASAVLRVAAVDDDPLVLLNTVAMLEDMGHDVIALDSGARVLALLEAGASVDVVVTDHSMPDMTGTELATALQARQPPIPVLLTTGCAEHPGATSPALQYLDKPFTQNDLAWSLEHLLHPITAAGGT